MLEWRTKLMVGLALLASACTYVAHTPPSSPDVIEAPFEIHNNHIRLPVRVGSHEYKAIYDSGAEVSVMSITVAQELGIQPEDVEPGHSFGGDVPSGRASNVHLDFGSGGYTFPHVAVVDFTPMLGPGADLGFILGQTLLPNHVVDIDPASHVLRWTVRSRFRAPAHATAMSMGYQNGTHTIPMSMNGVAGVAGVDVGASFVDISAAFAQRLNLDPNEGATRRGFGVAGPYQSRLTSVPVISIGGVEMRDVPVAINPGALPSGADINLGTAVLFRFRLMFDYAGRRAWFIPFTTAASAPFSRDLLGMNWSRAADRLRITFVSDRGPAHEAGLATGDEITAIDGVAVASWPAGQPLFAGGAGAAHHLTLADGRVVTLTMARYY